MIKLGIAVLALSAALFAAVGPASASDTSDTSDVAPKGQQWGTHGNITQSAADAAGSYAAAGRLQAQASFNISEWTSLPGTYLTSNLQTLFSRPGPARFYTEADLEQLRMLAMQRGVVLLTLTSAVSGPPHPDLRG